MTGMCGRALEKEDCKPEISIGAENNKASSVLQAQELVTTLFFSTGLSQSLDRKFFR